MDVYLYAISPDTNYIRMECMQAHNTVSTENICYAHEVWRTLSKI